MAVYDPNGIERQSRKHRRLEEERKKGLEKHLAELSKLSIDVRLQKIEERLYNEDFHSQHRKSKFNVMDVY